MPRTLLQIIASARATLHNRGTITLGSASIRTEDLKALCDAAQHHTNRELMPMSEFIAVQAELRDRFATFTDQD